MERRGVRGAAVAGVALCTVMALMIASTPVGRGAVGLLSLVPQPAYYPEPRVVAQGSMLAEEPGDAADAEGDEEEEDKAEGKELSELESEVDEETGKMFPFPEYAKPVHSAKVDQFGRILQNGNCGINPWDTHNLWPHKRDPDSDAEEYVELHSDPNKLLGTTYNFPQNPECLSEPRGMPPAAVDYRANNWGYRCFSNGKCALFQADKAEDGHYDDQLRILKGVDGIADDDQWGLMPRQGYRQGR